MGLQLAGRQVRPKLHAATIECLPGPAGDKLGVLGRLSPAQYRPLPIVQMVGERLGGGGAFDAQDAPLGQAIADRRRHSLDVPGQVGRHRSTTTADVVQVVDLPRKLITRLAVFKQRQPVEDPGEVGKHGVPLGR
ncbi:MAG TPA: hypothetical protein VHY37_08855 [Tepidisphaeraceae bacterium]|nr:hypothetical protein [Tepidisphaeraceae bacterium]